MSSLYSPDQTFGCIPMELAMSLPGREIFRKMMAGEIDPPPIYRKMNLKMTAAEDGLTRHVGRPDESDYNPISTVHGGWIGTILDAAMASCIHTLLPVGMGFTTLEYKVNLVRPLTVKTGGVTCEGRVIHFGRTTATSEARLSDASGKLLAHGVETCSIFSIKS
ncbi:PaaI family thioesterase [Thalassobius vesicularis]|uniref:PaaI family thioesterase n=2 Tax=Thalassobius vesicularis TaxID=1294297 RepID=A0A4S3M7L3_9RHOB|nr:PaaI family thioesterase [Thalassobius vesicularis]